MLVERNNILNNYAKENGDKGDLYYIYSKSSENYNLCSCEQGKNYNIIKLEESDLPKGAGVDSVLRLENGKYTLDETATEEILNEITEMINRLLEKQTQELEQYRIEGHNYEITENSGDRVWITDITKNDGEIFEEVDFPNELLDKEGKVFKYVNGEYQFNVQG